MKKTQLILLIILSSKLIFSQTSLLFVQKNQVAFGLSELNNTKFINHANQKCRLFLHVEMHDKTNALVFQTNLDNVICKEGYNDLNFDKVNIQWGNAPSALMLKNGSVNQPGLKLIFKGIVKELSSEVIMEELDDQFSLEFEGNSPLELTLPKDKSKLKVLNPEFEWEPPFPSPSSMEYKLFLFNKKEGQTCIEAIQKNLPLIQKSNIRMNRSPYPNESQQLEKGKKYCWYVTAEVNNTEYSKSSLWEFEVEDTVESEQDMYLIKNINGAIIHLNNNVLKFRVDNYSNQKILTTRLKNLKTSKVKEIEFDLMQLNNIIDLSEYINEGENFEIELVNLNGEKINIYVSW